jgi:hypothetical protein
VRLQTGRTGKTADQTASGIDFDPQSVVLSCAFGEATANGIATDHDFLLAYGSEKARWTEVIDRLK